MDDFENPPFANQNVPTQVRRWYRTQPAPNKYDRLRRPAIDDFEKLRRVKSIAQVEKWARDCRRYIAYLPYHEVHHSLDDVGIRMIAGVSPRVWTWGWYFPFDVYKRCNRNENKPAQFAKEQKPR